MNCCYARDFLSAVWWPGEQVDGWSRWQTSDQAETGLRVSVIKTGAEITATYSGWRPGAPEEVFLEARVTLDGELAKGSALCMGKSVDLADWIKYFKAPFRTVRSQDTSTHRMTTVPSAINPSGAVASRAFKA